MIRFIYIIFLFCSNFSFGQTRNVNGIISLNGDTSFWYKHQIKQLKKLSLPLLNTSSYQEYYRLWTNKQVIDIWQNSDNTFGGKLTTWTDEYVPIDEQLTSRSFIVTKDLSADTIKVIRAFFQSSNMLSLPTDDSIKGWQHGFDGITYVVEQLSKDNYSFKTYWTPKAQDSLIEAIQVQSYIDDVLAIVNAQEAWKSFTNLIPYECYINGGPGVTCKVLSATEKEKYIKERRKYLKQRHEN